MAHVGQTVPSRCFILQLSPLSSWHLLEHKQPTTPENQFLHCCMIPLHLLVGMDEFVHIGSISCSGSQGKMPGLGSVTATGCSYRCRQHLMPLGEGHNPPPRALLCSQMQFMVQPIQSCCSVTKGTVNHSEMWKGMAGMRTCPRKAVSLFPVPRCSLPPAIQQSSS